MGRARCDSETHNRSACRWRGLHLSARLDREKSGLSARGGGPREIRAICRRHDYRFESLRPSYEACRWWNPLLRANRLEPTVWRAAGYPAAPDLATIDAIRRFRARGQIPLAHRQPRLRE